MLSPFFGSGLELIVTCPLLNDKRKEEVLESIAARSLGPGTPFYQYYADSVHLHDAISFGHPAFTKLLLIPAPMEYLTDYRKSSWVDYGHVLRTVEVLSSPCTSFLELPSVNRERLARRRAFCSSVVRVWNLISDGLLRFVAVNYVRAVFWRTPTAIPTRMGR